MTQKKEDFYDKMKRFAEKTEDFIEDQVDKLKKSGTLDKAAEYADKTTDYIEKKAKEFQKSETYDKVDEWVDKTDKKAREVIKKVDDFMGDLHNKSKQNKNKPEESSENKPKIQD